MVFIDGMTIWILALLLLASCMALGHKLGAIRASVTFIGILIAEVLAAPLGGLVKPLLPHLGVKDPVLQWALPPLIMFIIVLAIFKSIGQLVHYKVAVYYKHYTDELQQGWWERMNRRVGMCVGTLNALAYVVILCSVIYLFSYWTVQFMTPSSGASESELLDNATPPDGEQLSIKLLDYLGRGLKSTGMIKVARAVDPLPAPKDFFEMADLAGLLYQNPQLNQRLADYPPFIGIGQSGPFQDLKDDTDFQNAWQNHGHLDELAGNDHAKAIWWNPDTAAMLWTVITTNLDDLPNYLQTGVSQKFTEPILGRWHFNVVSTIALVALGRPNFSSRDMMALRAIWTPAYAKTIFLASADGQAFIKNFPQFKPSQPNQAPQFDSVSYSGQWNGADGSYQLSLSGSNNDRKSGFGKTSNARLTLTLNGEPMVFDQ